MGEINFNSSNLGFENHEIPIEKEEQDVAVMFSIKLVELFAIKMRAHNLACSKKKVSLIDLKKVYIKGASNCHLAKEAGKTYGAWGLARVNMFLRQKLGDKMTITTVSLGVDNLVDISETWIPTEEDHSKAESEIKKHKLDYDFKSVDELYIKPYERSIVEW